MPNWNVEGADARTGQDRVMTVEAHSQAEAEKAARKLGLMVSAIHRVPAKTPAEALDEMVGSAINSPSQHAFVPAAAVPAASSTVAYRSPSTVSTPAPAYLGLKIGASVLSVFAILYYVFAVVVVIAAVVSASAPPGRFAPSTAEIVIPAVAIALTFAMVGAFLHAASAACGALRDIARNSFR